MLRLSFTAEPFWIPLMGDAQVRVEPFSSTILGRARAILRRGGDALPEATDEAVEAHFQRFATAIACAAITEWEGIGDLEGAPLPVTAETVAGVMSIPACADAFKVAYLLPAMEMLAEKKDLPPLSDGTSAAGRLIAVAAAKSAKPAPIQ